MSEADPAAPVLPPLIEPGAAVIAIVMPTWLGDTVMALPAVDRIAAARSSARLVAIVEPGLRGVLAGRDCPHEVIPVRGKGVAGPFRTAAALRQARAEAVVLLPNSPRAAIAAALSGCPGRGGYARGGRGRLLHRAVPVPRSDVPTSAVTYYDHLACALLGSDAGPVDPRPIHLVATAEQRAAASAAGVDLDRPRVIIVPGGNREAKRWPPDRFAAVARHLYRLRGLQPVVTGSPGERSLCAEVASAIGEPALDLAAAGAGLDAVTGAIAGARLVITNDTGPRHLAAGLGVPCVGLFGPTDPRWTTLFGAPETVLVAEPFLPPDRVADDHPDLCRIDRIPVSDVIVAAEARLAAAARPAASAAAHSESRS